MYFVYLNGNWYFVRRIKYRSCLLYIPSQVIGHWQYLQIKFYWTSEYNTFSRWKDARLVSVGQFSIFRVSFYFSIEGQRNFDLFLKMKLKRPDRKIQLKWIRFNFQSRHNWNRSVTLYPWFWDWKFFHVKLFSRFPFRILMFEQNLFMWFLNFLCLLQVSNLWLLSKIIKSDDKHCYHRCLNNVLWHFFRRHSFLSAVLALVWSLILQTIL